MFFFCFVDFYKSTSAQTINTVHKPMVDMMLKSKELCRALGQSSVFTSALVKRLKSSSDAIVLRSLLKELQLLFQFHLAQKHWVETNDLIAVVQELSQSDKKVLVKQLAKKLLLDFKDSCNGVPSVESNL